MPHNRCMAASEGRQLEKKIIFFSDAGKSLKLKRIVFKLCEIVVPESDELPKCCCRGVQKVTSKVLPQKCPEAVKRNLLV